MFSLKTSHLLLLLGLIAPVQGFAESHYCIAVDGGFGHGGTTFIGLGFSVPSEGNCTPWSGFTKTASSVILTTNGTGCLSSDGKALTVAVFSADPAYFAQPQADYISMTRADSKEPFKGEDTGELGGTADPVSCSSSLLHLPSSHD
jgi:hypothetical protein